VRTARHTGGMGNGTSRLTVAALLLALAPFASAQEAAHPAGCLALAGSVSRELMQRPIGLDPGAGRLHQEVTTRSREAQRYYDQGLAYLASYVWVEAARSFHQALRRDPDLAMAELGLARAYENAEALDEAATHLSRAEELAQGPAVPERERLWIRLGRQQHDAIHAPAEEQQERLLAYRGALDGLIAMDPSDPHAWVLRGNAEEPGAWGRGQAGGVGSIAYYEAALRRDPNHLGAHHFLAHSYENIGRHEAAADYARRYAADAPGVAHAQHMLGHVLPRQGKWREARTQFVKADGLERAYYRAEGIDPAEDWHHGHNLHLLAVVNLQLGDRAEAERYLREAFDLDERGVFAGVYAGPYVQFLLLGGRNQEALAAAAGIESEPTTAAQVIGAALTGEALLGLGREADARAALERAERRRAAAAAELADTRYQVFLPTVVGPYVEVLRGRLLLRGERPEEGDEVLLALARREVGDNPRLDAWASGLMRVERARADAEALGRTGLAAELARTVAPLSPPGGQASR